MVEYILAHYVNSDSVVHHPYNLPVHVGRDGKSYPYHQDDPTYLSRSPLGFRGCFKCGKVDHWTRNDCLMENVDDKAVMDSFFKELRTHKPNYRQPNRNREQPFSSARVYHHDIVRILRMHCSLSHIDGM